MTTTIRTPMSRQPSALMMKVASGKPVVGWCGSGDRQQIAGLGADYPTRGDRQQDRTLAGPHFEVDVRIDGFFLHAPSHAHRKAPRRRNTAGRRSVCPGETIIEEEPEDACSAGA
ncbi:hypothetical protein [Fodinicola feengrottensis]|uniref:hypothetical protein n=1 Tax=Fodinicola feengrottensis TaxID=435914 RepID=UPI002441EB3D|nr:hypothetical protein [Fodinicola feengrottensis]